MNERKYYAFGSTTIAMRENDEALTWLLTDQINSTTVTVSEDGILVSEIKYTAFGEVRSINGVMVTDNRYTGQREEVEIGLYYYVARFYDPVIAHFVQADTIVPYTGLSISFDRYAYVLDNPIRYSDPTGHMDYPGEGGGYIGGGKANDNQIVGQIIESGSTLPKPTRVDTANLTYWINRDTGLPEGGATVYQLYRQMYDTTSGWWWWMFDDQFTLENFLAVTMFYIEGSTTLANRGDEKQTYDLTLINAFAEGSVRALNGFYGVNGSITKSSLLNWAFIYSQSLLSRISAINSGAAITTHYRYTYNGNSAFTVAENFLILIHLGRCLLNFQ